MDPAGITDQLATLCVTLGCSTVMQAHALNAMDAGPSRAHLIAVGAEAVGISKIGFPSTPMTRMQQSLLAMTGSQSPTPGGGINWQHRDVTCWCGVQALS